MSITQCSNLASVLVSSRNTGNVNQVWVLSLEGAGTMVNTDCNTRAIDIENGYQADGTNIILWGTHGGGNQMWELVSPPTR